MSPSVSVILTVYNRFELTKRAVESVLNQSLPAREIILIDDGSFDGTSELLPRFVSANPAWRGRVQYFHQENQGPGAARNNGINLAKGEWLAFLDNDDLWLPQKLEWQFRALEQFKDRCGACITDAWFMNNPNMKMTLFQLAGKTHREVLGMIPEPLKYMLERSSAVGVHPVWLQNLVVRADLAQRAGGFDPRLRFGDDDDFAFRVACETQFCFVGMPMVIIDRTPPAERHNGVNKRWDDVDFQLQMAQYRMEKRVRMSDHLPTEIRAMVRKNLAAVHSGWANWYLHKAEFKNARAATAEATRVYLSPNLAAKWALVRCAPSLARRIILLRDAYRNRKTIGIG